jgi:hypothetical protein
MSREVTNYQPPTLPAEAPAPAPQPQQPQALVAGASAVENVPPHENTVKAETKLLLYKELKARLAKGEKPSEAMLDEAIQCESKSSVKLLVQNGLDLNRPVGPDGNTPLHNACMTGNGTAVRILLACGADVHVDNRDYMPPPSWPSVFRQTLGTGF